jgi:hypothetical protein
MTIMTNKEIINEIEEVVNKKHTIFNSMMYPFFQQKILIFKIDFYFFIS